MQQPRLSPGAARWLIAGCAIFLGALTHFGLHRALINDEAVEFLVAEGMTGGGYLFFTPDDAYARGTVDKIETLAPYLNRALFRLAGSWAKTRDGLLVPIHGLAIAAETAGCLLIFEVARRQQGSARRGLFAAICAGGSGYALLMNQFLTRNSLSLFWGALLVWLLDRWMRRAGRDRYPWAAACALTLSAGCCTYTIFKPMAAAVYGGLFLAWLRFSRRPADLGPAALSAAVFAACLGVLIILGGSNLAAYFTRGAYAVGGTPQYLHNLLLTLAAPLHYQEHGRFIEEDVHIMIGRAVLSPLLWLFFVPGLVLSFGSRRPGTFLWAAIWTLGMVVCASAGPNLKYQYAFFPLTLLLACLGVFALADRLPARWLPVLMPLFLAGYLALEMWQVFKVFPTSDRFGMNRFAKQIALSGIAAARQAPGRVVLQPGVGFDILNWYLWPPAAASNVRAYSSGQEMIDDLAVHPSPPPELLLIDYPPTALEWTPPPGLKMVNVRNDPP